MVPVGEGYGLFPLSRMRPLKSMCSIDDELGGSGGMEILSGAYMWVVLVVDVEAGCISLLLEGPLPVTCIVLLLAAYGPQLVSSRSRGPSELFL